MGFSRQECWSGLPFPSPGDLPNPGIEPRSPTLQRDALASEPPGGLDSDKEYPIVTKSMYEILWLCFINFFCLKWDRESSVNIGFKNFIAARSPYLAWVVTGFFFFFFLFFSIFGGFSMRSGKYFDLSCIPGSSGWRQRPSKQVFL